LRLNSRADRQYMRPIPLNFYNLLGGVLAGWHWPSLAPTSPFARHLALTINNKTRLNSISYDRMTSGNHAARLSPLHLIPLMWRVDLYNPTNIEGNQHQCSTLPLRLMLRVLRLTHIGPRISLIQLRSRRSSMQLNQEGKASEIICCS